MCYKTKNWFNKLDKMLIIKMKSINNFYKELMKKIQILIIID